MTFNRPRHARTVLLMLVIMLAQSLMGAVEVGLQSTSPVDTAGHHEAGDTGLPGTGLDAGAQSQLPTSGDMDDGCDHCCQCHGHCNHLIASGRPVSRGPGPQGSYLPPPHPNHAGVVPPALYRPPIA